MQLIDPMTEDQLWADKFDGTLGNIFAFLDDIVETIVTALEVRLSDGEQVRTWRKEARTAAAYEQFIRARAAYKEYSRAGNARARIGYQAAVELSPDFTSAMVSLARTHIEDATFSWSDDKAASLAEARRLIAASLKIAPNYAPAHFEKAHLLLVERDFEAALRDAERSTQIDPNSGEAYMVLAHVLGSLGHYGEAIRAANRAVQLNPSAPEYYLIPLLDSYIALSRYDEAVSVLERIEARRPDWVSACVLAVVLHMGLGHHEAARGYVDRLLGRNPSFTVTKWRDALFNPDREDIPDRVAQLRQAGLPE